MYTYFLSACFRHIVCLISVDDDAVDTVRPCSDLQKILRHGLLGRHATTTLRRGLEDTIPSARGSQIPHDGTRACAGSAPRTVRANSHVSVAYTVHTSASTTSTSKTEVLPDGFASSLCAVRAPDTASMAQVLADLENGSDIAAAVAVVRGAPDGDDAAVEHFLPAFHDELVGAGDHGDVVAVVELAHDVVAEEEAGAARGEAPGVDRVVRVGPEEVAHRAFVGHFLFAVDEGEVGEGREEGREPAVDAEESARGGARWLPG